MQVRFSGTTIQVFGDKQSFGGSATVSLDGVVQGVYSGHAAREETQQLLFEKTGLRAGAHILKITANGDGPIFPDAFVTSSK